MSGISLVKEDEKKYLSTATEHEVMDESRKKKRCVPSRRNFRRKTGLFVMIYLRENHVLCYVITIKNIL